MRFRLIIFLLISLFSVVYPSDIEPDTNDMVTRNLSDLGYIAVKMHINDFNMYEIDANINKIEIRLLLSSNHNFSLFNKHYLDMLDKDYFPIGNRKSDKIEGSDVYLTSIDDLHIGNLKIPPFDSRVIDFQESKMMEDVFVEGILGVDFLRKYNVIIDYGNEYIYFKIL